jgi:AcrR family transcriptional regulator
MKHSIVRQTIVETASALFYQRGYNLTGINEIIKEAGVAKATLYNHFKSKEEICIAYLKFKHTAFLEDLKSYVRKVSVEELKSLALFDFLAGFFESKNFNGCWCINIVSEIPRDNAEIRAEIQREKKEFMDLIGTFANHDFPDRLEEENAFLAKHIYLLYEGAVSESHLHQESWPIVEAKKMCSKLIE